MAIFDIAGAVENVKTMLQSIAAWQTICGVSTAAEAAKRIHFGVVEDDGSETLCPLLILDVEPITTTWNADRLRGKLQVEIRMELAIPEEHQRTPQAAYSWVWARIGEMMAGVSDGVAQSGELMVESFVMRHRPAPIEPDENFGRKEWGVIWDLNLDFV